MRKRRGGARAKQRVVVDEKEEVSALEIRPQRVQSFRDSASPPQRAVALQDSDRRKFLRQHSGRSVGAAVVHDRNRHRVDGRLREYPRQARVHEGLSVVGRDDDVDLRHGDRTPKRWFRGQFGASAIVLGRIDRQPAPGRHAFYSGGRRVSHSCLAEPGGAFNADASERVGGIVRIVPRPESLTEPARRRQPPNFRAIVIGSSAAYPSAEMNRVVTDRPESRPQGCRT